MSNWKYYVLPALAAVAYLIWLLVGSSSPEPTSESPHVLEAEEGSDSDKEDESDADLEELADSDAVPEEADDFDPDEIPEAMDATGRTP